VSSPDPAALAPGLTHRSTWTVNDQMGPPHLPVTVLSTPWMLGLIEQTCHDAARPYLPDHHTLVGTGVTLTHDAAAPLGAQVEVAITVLTVGRRMTFDAVVTMPTDTRTVRIGTATMEMAVVDITRFGR
jgi:fluoroacetyl-CoA thioesterase